jgi:SOS response regulatory protein OraA/RecX
LPEDTQTLASTLARYAARLLSARPYFTDKLVQKLRHKARLIAPDTDAKDIQAVLDSLVAKLSAAGYLNDLHYASELARTHLAKGYGPNRIRIKLISHRIDRSTISEVLGALTLPEIIESARKAVRGVSDPRRIYSRLYQRGFDARISGIITSNHIDDYSENVVE